MMKNKKEFDKFAWIYNPFIKLFRIEKDKQILNMIELTGKENVLDMGGGTGRLAKKLKEKCIKVYVVDESRGMLSKIKNHDNIKKIHGDILKTHFENNFFDIVFFTDVLHHIKEQDALIKEAKRILKPDGRIVVYDFDNEKFLAKLNRIFESIIFKKVYFKSKREIVELLKENNFAILNEKSKSHWFILIIKNIK